MFTKTAPAKDFTNNGYKPPEDVNVALLHTIIAVTALRDIMLKENEVLSHADTNAFLALQDEKIETGRRYEMLVHDLMSRADAIKGAEDNLKKQLERLQESFGTVAAENKAMIERMRNATQRLADRIMKNARIEAERQTQFAYGARGTMQKGTKATIGINERA